MGWDASGGSGEPQMEEHIEYMKRSRAEALASGKDFHFKDHYQILGVQRDATYDTIRTAYHKLAMKFHPDRTRHSNGISE
jgi:DnaJ-class molecular chaperone